MLDEPQAKALFRRGNDDTLLTVLAKSDGRRRSLFCCQKSQHVRFRQDEAGAETSIVRSVGHQREMEFPPLEHQRGIITGLPGE